MRTVTALLICFAMVPGTGVGQDFAWRDQDGQLIRDTDARKSSDGFGGWVITTSDADWAAKWATPAEETPSFTTAESVRKGERVETLIFIVNPLRNEKGEVDVRCDIRVTRPNGTVSLEKRGLPCLNGPLLGDPRNLRLAVHTLPFTGEEGDPLGEWVIDIALRDAKRGTTLNLRGSFEYVGVG
jgi:hypothetical protein